MKRTPRPATSKSVPSTSGGKCVKALNKKGQPPSTPAEFRTPVNKEWVTCIAEDVENLLHEEITQSSKTNYWMLQQIKSELKLLSNILHQNEMRSQSGDKASNTKKSGPISVAPSGIKSKKSDFQQNVKSKSFVLNKPTTVKVPKLRVNNENQTQPKIKEISNSNNERCSTGKSKLAIHSCFNINIESTLESDTKIVSETNTIEQLKSFWNDRMNNGQPLSSKDKTVDFDNTFEMRKRLHEELVARSSKQVLPDINLFYDYNRDNVSNGFGFNAETESETSIQTYLSGCQLPVRMSNKSVSSSLNPSTIKTLEESTKSFLSIRSIIESLQKMISILTCLSVDSQSMPIYSRNVHLPSEIKQIIVDLVKHVNMEYPEHCNKSVHCDQHSIKADESESIFLKDGFMTDESGNKTVNNSIGNSTQNMKITINIVSDCKNSISNIVRLDDDVIDRNNGGNEIGITVKIGSDDSLQITKDLVEHSKEPLATEDEVDLVMKNNLQKISLKLNLSEEVNISHSDISNKCIPEEIDIKQDDNICMLVNSAGSDFCKDTSTYFGGGDTSLDDVDSPSSSLKVNFSVSAQYVGETDFDMFSNTSYSKEISEEANNKVVKSASMNDMERKVSEVSIFQELKSLNVKTTIIDNGSGSSYEELKMLQNYSEEDMVNQVKELEICKVKRNEILSESSIIRDGDEFDSICNNNVILDLPTENVKESSGLKGKDIINKSQEFEQDSMETVSDRNFTTITTSSIHFYQEPIDNKLNMCNSLFFDKCLQNSLFAVLNDRSLLELICQKTVNNDFKSISETDVFVQILCNLAQQNLQRKSMLQQCSHFSLNPLKQISLNYANKTLNFIAHFMKYTKWNDVATFVLGRRALSNNYFDCRSLTTTKIASYIYHFVISLSLFFIIEEEVFGLFCNSKVVYPF